MDIGGDITWETIGRVLEALRRLGVPFESEIVRLPSASGGRAVVLRITVPPERIARGSGAAVARRPRGGGTP